MFQIEPAKRLGMDDVSDVGGVDRLSELPDDLLIRILSFLHVREAVHTQFISKRWENLWTMSSNLFFSLGYPEFEDDDIVTASFVNDFLARYKGSKLEMFGVHDPDYFGATASLVNPWVSFAIDRGVCRLILVLEEMDEQYKVPTELFSCASLVSLELHSCMLDLLGPVCLPCLTYIKLERIKFDGPLIEEFISGSPVLKKLVIDSCNKYWTLDLCITNPSLQEVCVIDSYDGDGEGVIFKAESTFEIFAPHLKSLSIKGAVRADYLVKDVSSLVCAELNFDNHEDVNLDCLKQLLCGLKCKCLKISGWFIQALSSSRIRDTPVEEISPVNARSVYLNIALLMAEVLGISRLVEICPNMEFLMLTFCYYWGRGRNPANCPLFDVDEKKMHDSSRWVGTSDLKENGGENESGEIVDECFTSGWIETSNSKEDEVENECWKIVDQCFAHNLHKLKSVKVEFFFSGGLLGGDYIRYAEQSFSTRCWRQFKLVSLILKHTPALEEMKIIYPQPAPRFTDVDARRRNQITQRVKQLHCASSNVKIIFQ